MADPLVSATFDPKTLMIAENFMHFASFVDVEMAIAMQEIATLLQDTAVANTWTAFQNPTGELASNVIGVVASPYEADLQVNAPQANRLEWGFVGADSLGRIYNNAPEPYAMPAIVSNEAAIIQLTEEAMFTAFDKAGGV
jgi:hypothetical protein